jgi:hypothetical protein
VSGRRLREVVPHARTTALRAGLLLTVSIVLHLSGLTPYQLWWEEDRLARAEQRAQERTGDPDESPAPASDPSPVDGEVSDFVELSERETATDG